MRRWIYYDGMVGAEVVVLANPITDDGLSSGKSLRIDCTFVMAP